MNAKRFPSIIDCGTGCPFNSASFGLKSNSSSWLGPPAMNRKMIFFARGLNPDDFGAIGFGSACASAFRSANNDPSAIDPNPSPHRLKKWRRVKYWIGSLDWFMDSL